MISPKHSELGRTRKFLICTASAVCMSLLSACVTPPAKPVEHKIVEPTAPAEPAALPAVEPAPPVLSCPEPEPVAPVVCPPPPKPKVCPVCPINKIDGKLLVGTVEYVKLSPPGISYQARIDSGAELTTLRAANIVRFERDGKKWVKFELKSADSKAVSVERQILRRVKASQIDKNGTAKHLVVMMSMTIGSVTEQVEMALDSDADTNQPVSIGRNFLHNNAIVDVSQKFIAK
jgi:hypothetical protein